MTTCDGDRIKLALQQNGVKLDDINWVISTHGHSDHIGNNNLFPKATQIVGNSLSKGETYYLHDFEKCNYVIDEMVEVMSTPGHTLSCVSVMVKIENETVAIVGDLFEKEEDVSDENIWIEAGSEDRKLQRNNRGRIVKIADWIVPGHGPKFKVTEEIRKCVLEQNLEIKSC